MNAWTKRDQIRGVATAWRHQYHSRPGKDAIYDALKKLDLNTATEEEVAAVIGNGSWTQTECDECGEDAASFVNLGGGYERNVNICIDCLWAAVDLLPKRPVPAQVPA